MTDNHITTIQEIYGAFGRGDIPAILERISDTPDWCMDLSDDLPDGKAVPFLRHVTTKDAIAETYFGNVVSSLEFHEFVPMHFFGSGQDVVTILHLDYTVRPTGRRVEVDEVHHFTFDADGKVARYRPFVDTALLIDAFNG